MQVIARWKFGILGPSWNQDDLIGNFGEFFGVLEFGTIGSLFWGVPFGSLFWVPSWVTLVPCFLESLVPCFGYHWFLIWFRVGYFGSLLGTIGSLFGSELVTLVPCWVPLVPYLIPSWLLWFLVWYQWFLCLGTIGSKLVTFGF